MLLIWSFVCNQMFKTDLIIRKNFLKKITLLNQTNLLNPDISFFLIKITIKVLEENMEFKKIVLTR